MKNEIPEKLTADNKFEEVLEALISSGYIREDLTDRRTDVDALIRFAERVFYEHGEIVNMHSNDDLADKLWEAIQAIRGKRE